MPRPKRPGAPEPKKRSRNGCWPCKERKVKCGEERPSCVNCQRTGDECDYSIRLNWEGRRKKNPGFETILFQTPSEPSSSSSTTGARRHARRPSDAKSTSSTTTTTATNTLTPNDAEGGPVPRSEPQGVLPPPPPPPSSAKSTFPGMAVFTAEFGVPSRDDTDELPLTSPSLVSPLFSLPPPQAFSPNLAAGGYVVPPDSSQMAAARQPPYKRLRYSVDLGSPHTTAQVSPPVSTSTNDTASSSATPRFTSAGLAGLTPTASIDSPLTPAASSPYSDEGAARSASSRQTILASPDIRRMSVNSLLSGPPGPVQYAPPSQRALNARTTLCLSEVTTCYGADPGFPDLDLGKNDDLNAIRGLRVGHGQSPNDFRDLNNVDEDGTTAASPEGYKKKTSHSPKGYYERPVPVCIPQDLEPLPAKLRDNPMNLLYFHHFMNHTANALVPHDDQQSNPYRHVLPQMAVKNDNLLSLMLAYSASHRAHLLGHPEPATRIAMWVQDIFPALRRALNDPNQSISNANIATGIMLASLEIVSPTAFGYQIPWQRHLGLARDLIASRPDGIRWTRNWTQEDQVRAFLWSWLAYLDVLGTLSGGRRESSTAWILEYQKDEYEEEWDEIDCIMGMTTRCVYILAKVAELAKECDALRTSTTSSTQQVSTSISGTRLWDPPKDIIQRVWALEDEAKASMAVPPQPCKHLHASGNVANWEQKEIAALNEAFHWAGLVHLHRRVLAKPSSHVDVQAAVLKIHACLDCIPMGGNPEASLLFPLFTAACETADEERRELIRERIGSMGRTGFLQVQKAKSLIEQVWDTGEPWESLLTTEFIG